MRQVEDLIFDQIMFPAKVAPVQVSVSGTSAVGTLSRGKWRIVSTIAVRFLVGSGTPTALSTSHYLPADLVDYVDILDSTSVKIAVRSNDGSSTGKLICSKLGMAG